MYNNCFQLVFPECTITVFSWCYTVCKYITYLYIVVFQHHPTGHDCHTRIPHETPCQRPVPHFRAVQCPFCTRVCSSEVLLLEHVLTRHRHLCRGAKTTTGSDDDSSDKADTMVVDGDESLSLSRSGSIGGLQITQLAVTKLSLNVH